MFFISVFKRNCFRCLAVAGWLWQWECNESLTEHKMFGLWQQRLIWRSNCPKASLGAEVSPVKPLSQKKAYMQMYCSYIYKKINDRAEVDSAYNKKLRKYWRRFHHVSISLICNKKTIKWQGACTKTQLSKAYAEHTLKHMHYVDPTDLFLCFILKHRHKYCLPQITFTHLIRSWILQS